MEPIGGGVEGGTYIMIGQSPRQKHATKRNWLKGCLANLVAQAGNIQDQKLLSPEDYHDFLQALNIIRGILKRWDPDYTKKVFATRLKVKLT